MVDASAAQGCKTIQDSIKKYPFLNVKPQSLDDEELDKNPDLKNAHEIRK